MLLYNFVCSGCKKLVRKFLAIGQQTKRQTCDCGAVLKRAAGGPSSQKMDVLDNGLMPRRIERLADAEALSRDRAKNDPRMNPR